MKHYTKLNEHVELDEISGDKLKRYHAAAVDAVHDDAIRRGAADSALKPGEELAKPGPKVSNRERGISNAIRKATRASRFVTGTDHGDHLEKGHMVSTNASYRAGLGRDRSDRSPSELRAHADAFRAGSKMDLAGVVDRVKEKIGRDPQAMASYVYNKKRHEANVRSSNEEVDEAVLGGADNVWKEEVMNESMFNRPQKSVEPIDELSKKTLASYVNKSAKQAVGYAGSYRHITINADGDEEYTASRGSKEERVRIAKLIGRRSKNRIAGINKATNRLAQEDVEQIDELSRKTLMRYAKKADTQANRAWDKASSEEDRAMSTDGNKYPEKQARHNALAAAAISKYQKRSSGRDVAVSKIGKTRDHAINRMANDANFGGTTPKAKVKVMAAEAFLGGEKYKGELNPNTKVIDELSRKTLRRYLHKSTEQANRIVDKMLSNPEKHDTPANNARWNKRLRGSRRAMNRLAESNDLRKHLEQNYAGSQEDDRSWYSHDKKTGEHVIRRGFFYRHGGSAEKHAQAASKQLSDIGVKHTVTGHGEVYKPFRGGANVKNQSHWWVKFKVHEGRVDEAHSAADLRRARDFHDDRAFAHSSAELAHMKSSARAIELGRDKDETHHDRLTDRHARARGKHERAAEIARNLLWKLERRGGGDEQPTLRVEQTSDDDVAASVRRMAASVFGASKTVKGKRVVDVDKQRRLDASDRDADAKKPKKPFGEKR